MIEIKIDDREVQKALQSLSNRLKDMTPVMRKIAGYALIGLSSLRHSTTKLLGLFMKRAFSKYTRLYRISNSEKKYFISNAAVSGESEP